MVLSKLIFAGLDLQLPAELERLGAQPTHPLSAV